MVRARPDESACLISLVDRLVSVIFLAPLPWLACRWLSSCCLSPSVNASDALSLATPAALSCCSNVSGVLLSSLANSATVLLDIYALNLPDLLLSFGEPVFTRLHDQSLRFFLGLPGQLGQLVDGQIGQIV